MNQIVFRIPRGRSAGKWKAKFEIGTDLVDIGTFDTEDEATASFDDFVPGYSERVKTKRKAIPINKTKEVKLTKEEWKAKSVAQIKLLSKKYA